MGASIIINSSAVASDASSKASTTHSGNLLPLLEEIRGLAAAESAEDPAAHSRLLSKIHALNLAVETPLETILKIGYQPWQIVAIRVALDLNVFVFLAEQEPKPISVEELASNAGADVILLARIMRVIMALGLCSEVGSGRYAANSKTAIMTTPLGSAGFRFWTDMSMPTAAKLPDSLRGNSYSNPRDNKTTAFAQAFGAEFWTWLKQNPEHAKEFNGFMASRRQGRPGWFDIYPVEQELSMTVEDGAVVLVDVGGNQGHDLVNLKKKYPNLRGNFILQDLPEVVAKATFNDEDITAMGYNFFEPQPVKRIWWLKSVADAHAYHFRAIFHDWPDAACIQILKQTAHAMKPGFSKLLISEFVLANTETALLPASLDLQMMGLHAGTERSEGQWRALLKQAGLEVQRVWQKVVGEECVIEAGLS